MRKLFAAFAIFSLSACQTSSLKEDITNARPVSGTLGKEGGDCYFFRTTDGRFMSVSVTDGTIWQRGVVPERFVFPDRSVADFDKQYEFLGLEVDRPTSCHQTSIILFRVLKP